MDGSAKKQQMLCFSSREEVYVVEETNGFYYPVTS